MVKQRYVSAKATFDPSVASVMTGMLMNGVEVSSGSMGVVLGFPDELPVVRKREYLQYLMKHERLIYDWYLRWLTFQGAAGYTRAMGIDAGQVPMLVGRSMEKIPVESEVVEVLSLSSADYGDESMDPRRMENVVHPLRGGDGERLCHTRVASGGCYPCSCGFVIWDCRNVPE